MKTKKMLTLMLAVMLLVASLAVTVHADVEEYTFDGNCKRFFTTKKYLKASDKVWPVCVYVECYSLDFNGGDNTDSYDYGCVRLVNGDGTEFGDFKDIEEGEIIYFDLPNPYKYKTLKVRFFHPYYQKEGTTASSTMHITGEVEKSEMYY